MKSTTHIKEFLEYKAYKLRLYSLIMTAHAGSGHPTSCLSAADLVAAIFFDSMRYDPHYFDNPDNDRFILSKGHASPLLYAAWKEVGVLSEQQLYTYRRIDSVLEGHPTFRFAYSEAATGSLGIGLSIGVGMSLSAKMDGRGFYTYVLMGDSELAEGSVWEAIELAHYYKLNNLIAIIDVNRLGQSTQSLDGHHMQRYVDKFKAFGWHTIDIDGHDMHQIMQSFQKAREHKDHPTVIIAKTIKGYGIARAENIMGFHGKPFELKEIDACISELQKKFSTAVLFDESLYVWKPKSPEVLVDISDPELCVAGNDKKHYERGSFVATRLAYGHALVRIGALCQSVVSLDAEVKNSTYAELFEKVYPDRFVQCFIAEQNMVGMGIGMQRRGKIPFISTFATFFSRAYDQIRMAAIGSAALRLVGSHAGVSIGQDGPSQMGLEDMSIMRAIPGSVVLYPSDAISTHGLMDQMLEYNQGISYLRTTRMATPVLYNRDEDFFIGGCKVLRRSQADDICIIAAGITLHEALKAYTILLQQGIVAAVIDLYSIKPIDQVTIQNIADNSKKRIITVEDHYLEGGLGQAVVYALKNSDITIECLAVTQLPRSGGPEELMALMEIDTNAIVKKAMQMVTQSSKNA
jgi:transketolase